MGVCFYGPNLLGVTSVPALLAATLALTIQSSAYFGEIWRGCIQSVERSQWEAAECLGFSRLQRMALVILPQALGIATPPTVGFLVETVKNTSLASLVIGTRNGPTTHRSCTTPPLNLFFNSGARPT